MARLITSNSSPSAPSNICIFDSPDSQIAFQKGSWHTFVPAFNSDSSGPFIFQVHDSRHFLYLSKTYISFKLSLDIIDPGQFPGPVQPVHPSIAPTNFIGCALFNQVKVALNNVQLYDSTHYAYKAYVQTLLGCKSDYKKSILSAAGWVDDVDSVPLTTDNEGFKTRVKSLKSGSLDICAPLLIEPFMTEKLLLPHVNLQITLYRNNDEFVLESDMDNIQYNLSISDVKLHMRAIDVTPSAALAIENKLKTTPARYPYTSIKVKVLPVSGGRYDLPFTALYHDIIPRRILIGLLDPEAMEGSLSQNSFNFQHFNISEVTVDAGGTIYPSQPMTTDFNNKSYARAFVNLFEDLGCVSDNRCPKISYKSFLNGNCFFCVNLAPMDSGDAWELLKNGTTQLQLKFNKKVPSSGLNVVVFSFFDNQYSIDSFRNIFNENQ